MWLFKRKPARKPLRSLWETEKLTKEMLETDAEAARLLDSDPTYKKNIKPGPPVDGTEPK